MNDAIAKLEAQVDALEDLTLRAFDRYLFLKPMLTNDQLIARINSQNNGDWFHRLRGWLYWGLIQELAKICVDSDPRSPSISTFRSELADNQGLLSALEEKYVGNILGVGSAEELKAEFRAAYQEFDQEARRLLESNTIVGYKTIRDKLISHNELNKHQGNYQFHQVQDDKLKHGEERAVLETLRELTIGLLLLIKSVDTNWDSYLTSSESLVGRFWGLYALS